MNIKGGLNGESQCHFFCQWPKRHDRLNLLIRQPEGAIDEISLETAGGDFAGHDLGPDEKVNFDQKTIISIDNF